MSELGSENVGRCREKRTPKRTPRARTPKAPGGLSHQCRFATQMLRCWGRRIDERKSRIQTVLKTESVT